MKVVIVSQYYDPEPVPLPGSLARGLADRGHDVHVVTAFPNYPEGRVYDGYRQRRRWVSVEDGVTVHRVPIFASHSSNPVARALNYLSFAFSSRFVGSGLRDADVTYVYATQMTAATGPAAWRRRRGIPYVLHVQDLWPESVTASGMLSSAGGSWVARVLHGWLGRLYRGAAAIVATSEGMREVLAERGAEAGTAVTVYNWSPQEHALDARDHSSPNVRIMYAGNLGHMQDLEMVIRAFALVADEDRLSLTIVGTGVLDQSLRDAVQESTLSSVTFVGRVGQEQMDQFYAQSDFQLVSLRDSPVFRMTVPSKFQASISRGLPVISTVPGELARIVEGEGIGISAPPSDDRELAAALRRAAELSSEARAEMGRRAREYYERVMSRGHGIDSIEAVLNQATERRAQR